MATAMAVEPVEDLTNRLIHGTAKARARVASMSEQQTPWRHRQMPSNQTSSVQRRRSTDSAAQSPTYPPDVALDLLEKAKRSEHVESAEKVIEMALCEEVGELLGVSVEREDNFLGLGGHSITAMRLVARVRRRLHVNMRTEDVFNNPILSKLAVVLSTREAFDCKPTAWKDDIHSNALSSAQVRLWFMDQLDSKSAGDLVPFAVRLSGRPQLESLNRALEALQARHEILRTTFEPSETSAVPLVHSARPRTLWTAELQQEDQLAEAIKAVMGPFDLGQEFPWKACLFHSSTSDFAVLVIIMHHIICDGWSVGVFCRELSEFYSAACENRLDALKERRPPVLQYRDFAAWQQQVAQTSPNEHQLKYWTEHLRYHKPGQFLLDTSRTRTPSYKASATDFFIDHGSAVTDRLQAFCRDRNVTPFVVLFSAFRMAHFRLTGAMDATIGTVAANRAVPGTQDLIGPLINLLCLRVPLDGQDCFEALIHGVRNIVASAMANSDVPFDRVVSAVSDARDTSRHPLFQLAFALHAAPDLGEIHLSGLDSSRVPLHKPSTRFDVELHLYYSEAGISGTVVYASDLFRSSTIRSIIEVFQGVLGAGLNSPTTPISCLPLPSEIFGTSYEDSCEPKHVYHPREMSLVDIWQHQISVCGNAVAVEDASSQLTYIELDRLSENIATWLRSQELADESLVAILAPRSCAAVAIILGIMKANLAYLPLDIKAPATRIDTILSESETCKIVFLGDGVNARALSAKVKCIRLHDIDHSATTVGRVQLPTAISLACVMYTSGSTGVPKGIMIEHRGIVRLVKNGTSVEHLPSPPFLRIAHAANLAFDMSTWEIWAALANGGTVVCIDSETALDTRGLCTAFERSSIRAVMLPPCLLRKCLDECPNALSRLEILHVGGERISEADARTAKALVPHVYNVYGPTENTVLSTVHAIEEHEVFVNGVPIGKAISGSRAFVMDPQLRLVPAGVVGELVVTGDGLARGYTDPALDRGRFVRINIDGQEMRAYRTGDLVRRRSDGVLEFLGRSDTQVKIRGNRVEPEEIECALLTRHSVGAAVVVKRTRLRCELEEIDLVAFVTLRPSHELACRTSCDADEELRRDGEESVTEASLIASLRSTLPTYMIPARVIVRQQMPVNANGKLDRACLELEAQQLHVRPATKTMSARPIDYVERAICEEFGSVLNVNVLNTADNFFDLGGHSLMASKISTRLSRRLDVNISLRDVLSNPTSKSLAIKVRASTKPYNGILRAPLTSSKRLSFAQARLFFLDQLMNTTCYLVPVAIRIRGMLNLDALTQAWNALEERHNLLRTTFASDDYSKLEDDHPAHFSVIPTVRDYQPRDLTIKKVSSENQLQSLLQREQSHPFDLSDQCWRLTLFHLDPVMRDHQQDGAAGIEGASSNEYVLSLVMHHIITDGWSIDVICRELAIYYSAACHKLDLELQVKPLAIQYHDFAAWQQDSSRTPDLQEQLQFWTTELAGGLPATFPLDHTRPQIPSGRAGAVEVHVSKDLCQQCVRFQSGTTVFMLLLACFRAAHYCITTEEDAVLATPCAGRNRQELEDIVGCFVNVVCVRTRLNSDSTFYQLLDQVRRAVIAASVNQDVPFEQVVARLEPGSNDISKNPLAQILFAIHPQPIGCISLEGLSTEIMRPSVWTTRLDLEVHLYQSDDALSGYALFAADLYDVQTVTVIVSTFLEVLTLAPAAPDMPLSSLAITGRLPRVSRQRSASELSTRDCTDFGEALAHDVALRVGDMSGAANDATYVAPHRAMEVVVCSAFAEVLHVPSQNVGVTDSFFALGGHSLMAMKLAARLSQQLTVSVSVRDIFIYPTARLLAAQIPGFAAIIPEPVPRREKRTDIPLSFAQHRLWFLRELGVPAIGYSMPLVTKLHGTLDLDALESAIHAVIRRHEALRTVFVHERGHIVQKVLPYEPRPLPVVRTAADDIEQALLSEYSRPFDLTQEVGFRARVFHIKSEENVLFIVMHHMVSDGWSVDILCRQLAMYYNCTRQRSVTEQEVCVPSTGPDVKTSPAQYSDYAIWQQSSYVLATKHEAQLAFWKHHLSGSQPAEFFCDYSRKTSISHEAHSISFTITGEQYDLLDLFSSVTGRTFSTILLAVFRATQYRMRGMEDGTIGIPVANRGCQEWQDVIGLFVNVLCIRTTVNDETSFDGLAEQVKHAVTAGLENQDVPFERVVSELCPGLQDRHPLIQVLFAFHAHENLGDIVLDGLISERLMPAATTGLDLEMHITQGTSMLHGQLVFAKALYDMRSGQAIIDNFLEMLRRVLGSPEGPISQVPLTDGIAWLHTQGLLSIQPTEYPRSKSIVDVFREQVMSDPHAIAVEDHSGHMTYSELDKQSTHLAIHLRSTYQFPPESLVGVLLPRSSETLVAFMGILKASLAYLPLDETTPAAWLDSLLEATPTCKLILLRSGAEAPIIKRPDVAFLRVSEALSWHASLPECYRSPKFVLGDLAPGPCSLAYVIFTSGSTGKPKGVMIEHRGVVRLAKDSTASCHLARTRRMAHLANIVFDASTWEIYVAILNGRMLVCIPQSTVLDTETLAKTFNEKGVDAACMTPSLLQRCWDFSPSPIATLKVLHIAGEPLAGPDAVRAIQTMQSRNSNERPTNIRPAVYNAYGPTENSVASTVYQVGVREYPRTVPIGRPIANSGAFVMDADQRLVSPGVIGELVVIGDGLGRGYLDQALNSNRFIEIDDPAQVSGPCRKLRAYRTGDLVRMSADGQLEYLGRVDQTQKKVRGHRVELSAIEHVILSHELIEKAAVVAVEHEETKLVAFVAARISTSDHLYRSTHEKLEQAVREHLQLRLPSYMVPTAVVVVDTLPLSSNGKVDRHALTKQAQMMWSESRPIEIHRNPQNDLEAAVLTQFAHVVGVDPASISTTADFFHLGGHSLMASRLAARISTYIAKITVKAIFEHRTVLNLATYIETTQCRSIEAFSRTAESGPTAMSFEQSRLWFLEQVNPRSYLMPFVTKIEGDLDVAAVEAAFRAVQQRHETLRTTFRQDVTGAGVSTAQIVHAHMILDLPVTTLHGVEAGDQLRESLTCEQTTPFDLEREPGFRIRLFQLPPTGAGPEYVLSVVMHHIISDGWSLHVLCNELEVLYAAAIRGVDPVSAIEPLPVQYRDFIMWQRSHIEERQSRQERQTEVLKHSCAAELPSDWPRPTVPSGVADVNNFAISETLHERLRHFCRKTGTTTFAVLLTVFVVTLQRLSGVNDAVVGTPVANRGRQELEGLIGLFADLRCVRIAIAEESLSLAELVEQVSEVVTDALEMSASPFGDLVSQICPDNRDLSRNPLVQIVIVHHEQNIGRLHLEGLRTELLKPAAYTTRFDIEMHIIEGSADLQCSVLFARELYHARTIDAMVKVFMELLDRGLEKPEAKFAGLQLGDYALTGRHFVSNTDTDKFETRTDSLTSICAENALATPPYAPPRDKIEEKLCKLYSLVLNGPDSETTVGIYDSFFNLGGHSLLATDLAARIRQDINAAIAVKDIFEAPSVESLAARVRNSDRMLPYRTVSSDYNPFELVDGSDVQKFITDQILPHVRCARTSILDIYPATHTQNVHLCEPRTGLPRANVLFYWDLSCAQDVRQVENACHAVVQHFDILRTVFVSTGGHLYQVVLRQLDVSIISTSVQNLEQSMTSMFADHLWPLQSHGQALLRFSILHQESSGIRVVLEMSHALYDGLSFEPMSRAFHAFLDNTRPEPAPPFSRYVKYMLGSREQGLDYWRRLLADSSPTNFSCKHDSSDDVVDVGGIGDALTQASCHTATRTTLAPPTSRPDGITPATMFTAACALALVQEAPSTSDLIFGRAISGRQGLSSDLQHVVGPCVNTVPVRIHMPPASPSALLQEIQQQYLSAAPYETVGFDDIRDDCTNWPASMANLFANTAYHDFSMGGTKFSKEWAEGGNDAICELEIAGMVAEGGELCVGVSGRKGLFDEDDVTRIVGRVCESLGKLCRGQEDGSAP